MLDQIFGKQVAGGSQTLLDNYATRIDKASATMGDLVFFKAPGTSTDKIVHVGVYLMDEYFVHATSTCSAAEGLGLKVDSLNDERWSSTLVAVGKWKISSNFYPILQIEMARTSKPECNIQVHWPAGISTVAHHYVAIQASFGAAAAHFLVLQPIG